MRKAKYEDMKDIKNIIDDAILLLKEEGIDQWQNGTPNLFLLGRQISKDMAYVYGNDKALAYAYLSADFEPTYGSVRHLMKGEDYYTIHTFCVARDYLGQGLATKFFEEIIDFAKKNNKDSIRIDTHKDNIKMRGIIEKMGFGYKGIIYINDNGPTKERLAYELIL